MEAPEKIYIQPNAHDGWFETNNRNESLTEYTHTDAFIQKAAIWFDYNFIAHDECGSIGVISYSFDTEEEMVKDFIEYMKGE